MSTLSIQPRRLILVGSILVDILMYIEHLPERGGDTLADKTVLTSGGGMNILSGAMRLGLPACYAGRVGDGPMGEQIITDLTRAGIPLLLPRIQGEDSGFDVGLVEANGERTFVTAPGTEARLTQTELQMLSLQSGDAVYVSGYDLAYPVSGVALTTWLPTLPSDILLILDPGPLVADIPATRLNPVLARTTLLSLNQRELTLLSGQADLSLAIHTLLPRLSADAYLIARTGAAGCWLAGADLAPCHIPGRATTALDTTGAGDTHVAALLASLARDPSLERAARIANVAASLSVERRGPSTCPMLEELQLALTAFQPD